MVAPGRIGALDAAMQALRAPRCLG
jgi:hypothetical protein